MILIVTGIIFSCSKDNDDQNFTTPNLIGKWKLIETFEDPGDGSGIYKSIDSEKTIEFFNNGTFTINGPLCGLSTSVGENITGKVGNSSYSENKILISNEECDPNNPTVEYGIVFKNSDLIIYYSACIEGCSHKYKKINAE